MGRLTILIPVMIAVLVWSCGTGNIAGNSSETTNGLTVIARSGTIEGTAPPFSSLHLFVDYYSPFSGIPLDSVITDSTGIFSFRAPETRYNLFCHDENGMRSYVRLTMNAVSPINDTIRDTLKTSGSLEGYAFTGTDSHLKSSYLYLEGSPYFTVADSVSGYFRIDDIPEGRYTVRLFKKITVDEAIAPYEHDTVSQESPKVIDVKSDSVLTVEWRW